VRLLFSVMGGEGHLRPVLPLARAAAARGHEVLVTGAPVVAQVPEDAGLAFATSAPDVVPHRVPLVPVDMEREFRGLRESFAGWMARARVADLLTLCPSWRPDLIVRDEADFAALVVAERLGLPHARVVVCAAGGLFAAAGLGPPVDALRAEQGLPPDPDLAALDRELVLSPFPPSFRDPADPLPDTTQEFRADGPVEAPPPVVARLRGDRPVVYVTLGTIVNTESGDVFPRVLAGLRDLPIEVVVTVGRSMDPEELGPRPANVHVERFVPQAGVLPYCEAVISHAGSGSVLGALEHGLPLVCIPISADQPLNAARCAALGVGVALDAIAFTPADLRAATVAALEQPAYRAAAARLQAEVAALPPAAEAVGRLERHP
jgi:UDP:flavonoid glycosyltransferase YjiC (YdhE family)